MHSDRTLPDAVVWRLNLYGRSYQSTENEDAPPPSLSVSSFDTYVVVPEAL